MTVSNNINSATLTKNNFIRAQTADFSNAFAFVSSVMNLTVRLNAQAPGATNYLWNFGDGNTSTLAFPQHTYAVKGTYNVTCTVSNSCGSAQLTVIVEVGGDPPSAAFTPSATTACAPASIQFTNQTTAATTYAWTFPGGTPATSNVASPSVSFAAAGSYNVRLITTNQWGSDTATTVIMVNPQPVAQIASVQVDTSTVSVTSTLTNATSQIWYFGDGGFAITPQATHTYQSAGAFNLMLIATNDCGIDTAFSLVTINGSIPVASFVAIPNQGCAPLMVTYQDQSLPAPTFRQWTFPGGTPATSSDANPTVVYNTGGVFGTQLIVGSPFGRDTAQVAAQVTVSTAPSANFTFVISRDTVTFTFGGSGQQSVLWVFGDGTPNSTQLSPVHVYPPGTYTVRLSATNDCGTSLVERTFTITTSVNNPIDGLQPSLRIIPNPATHQVYLEGLESGNSYQVEFHDAIGRKVKEEKMRCGTDKCGPVDISDLYSGTYRVIVKEGKLVKWATLVKI